jgi:two-component system, response regulator YesN
MSRSCRAIVIDDEAWIREGLCEHINWSKLGIELKCAFADALNALNYVREHPIHIILSDIRMPNMTGLQMLRQLRNEAKSNPNLTVIKHIFLSGFGDFEYAQEAIRLGAIDYLLKPADTEDIEKALLRAKMICDEEQKISVAELTRENYSYLVRQALELIQDHFTEDLQLSQVAEALFITPNYLSRLFRQETGKSFSEFIQEMRIKKACELLSLGKLKIYQVGEAVGYPNPRYFSEWFQKHTGYSPKDFRNHPALGL